MPATVCVASELPAGADRVWAAMQRPETLRYVTRGVIGWPALAGRTEPIREGESGAGWLFLFHVLPLHKHHIAVRRVDPAARTIETDEHGGPIRRWHHTLRVEPLPDGRSRYSDTIELDAGPLTPVVERTSRALYAYRHRRWRRLAASL